MCPAQLLARYFTIIKNARSRFLIDCEFCSPLIAIIAAAEVWHYSLVNSANDRGSPGRALQNKKSGVPFCESTAATSGTRARRQARPDKPCFIVWLKLTPMSVVGVYSTPATIRKHPTSLGKLPKRLVVTCIRVWIQQQAYVATRCIRIQAWRVENNPLRSGRLVGEC